MQNTLTRLTILTLSLVALSLPLTACSQYPENSKVTLKSKKARFANDWTIDQILFNGVAIELTEAERSTRHQITQDGGYALREGSSVVTGAWYFNDDESYVTVDIKSSLQTYEIIKLEHRNMWLESEEFIDGEIAVTQFQYSGDGYGEN